MATVKDVREVALAVATLAGQGATEATKNGRDFDLTETGMCMRFTRQVEEAAQDLSPFAWPWARHYAIQADFAMRDKGLRTDDHERADVVCFNANKPAGATPGHIACYLGGGMVAENTSSASRGIPEHAGTKLTHIDEIDPTGERRIFFRTLPWAEADIPHGYEDGPVTVFSPANVSIPCHGYLSNGCTGCNDARNIFTALQVSPYWPASYPSQMAGPGGELLDDCTAYRAGATVGVNNLRALLEAYGFDLVDDIPAHRRVLIVNK